MQLNQFTSAPAEPSTFSLATVCMYRRQGLYPAVTRLLRAGTRKTKVFSLARFAGFEKSFVVIFFVIAGSAVCLATILNMQSEALLLLLANLIVAGFVAIFGSLRSRQEEEEKRAK